MPIHDPARKAEAIGLAMTLGADEAAARTGIPRRTISRWLTREETPEPPASVVDRLWQAVEVGTDAVLAGLADPRSRLSDRARALEVASRAHALLTGGLTSRSEIVARDPDSAAVDDLIDGLSWEEKAELRNAYDDALERILAARSVTLAPVDPPRLGDGRNGT